MSGAAALPLASSFPRAIVLVEVTAADIRRGRPCQERHCPIVLAVDRLLIDGLGIEVDGDDIIFSNVQGYPDEHPERDPLLWAVALPDIARQFVADIDSEHEARVEADEEAWHAGCDRPVAGPSKVQPIRFELEVPAAYVATAPKTTQSWEAPA